MPNNTSLFVAVAINLGVLVVAGFFVALWVSSIESRQLAIEAQVENYATDVSEVKESVTDAVSGREAMQASLRQESSRIDALQVKVDQSRVSQEDAAAMVSTAVEEVRKEMDAKLADQGDEIMDRLAYQRTEQKGPDAASTPMEASQPTSYLISAEQAQSAISGIASRRYNRLYAFPPDAMKKRTVFVSDTGGVFYLDKPGEILENAFPKHTEDVIEFVANHIRKEFRSNREEFDKLIYDQVGEKYIDSIKARNLSSRKTLRIEYNEDPPKFERDGLKFTAKVVCGNVEDEITPTIKYTDLPGLVEVEGLPPGHPGIDKVRYQ